LVIEDEVHEEPEPIRKEIREFDLHCKVGTIVVE